MEIDITLSVLLKKATSDCYVFLDDTIRKYSIPEDMKEIILENLLSKSREEKLNLYSSAILKRFLEKKDKKEDK